MPGGVFGQTLRRWSRAIDNSRGGTNRNGDRPRVSRETLLGETGSLGFFSLEQFRAVTDYQRSLPTSFFATGTRQQNMERDAVARHGRQYGNLINANEIDFLKSQTDRRTMLQRRGALRNRGTNPIL